MAQRKKGNSIASLVLIIVLFLGFFLVKHCSKGDNKKEVTTASSTKQTEIRGLDRNPAAINYSKHARCRMECRHIDESEVKEILQTGKINYGKSEIGDNPDCKRKYAVEGKTHDNQRVRIIFAPCQSEVTVVTVIDLGTEWTCDCP
jgi:hypothetical protein